MKVNPGRRVKIEAECFNRFKVSAILCTFLVAIGASKGLCEDKDRVSL